MNKDRSARDKEYGGFTRGMGIAARIATELTQKNITRDDFFKCMLALKLSRLALNTKHLDSYTDLIGYAEGLWNSQSETDVNSTLLETLKNLGKEIQEKMIKRPKGHEFTGGPIVNEEGPELVKNPADDYTFLCTKAEADAINSLTRKGFKITQ